MASEDALAQVLSAVNAARLRAGERAVDALPEAGATGSLTLDGFVRVLDEQQAQGLATSWGTHWRPANQDSGLSHHPEVALPTELRELAYGLVGEPS